MIRRRRSPLRYLVPALIVGGALWWAHSWFFDREAPLPAGRIPSVRDEVREAYSALSGDFRAKVPLDEFTAMFHRMADPDNAESLPRVHQAVVFDTAGPEPPRARLRVEYPPAKARAEYHFAREEGEWKLQSFARVEGQWQAPPVASKAPAPAPAAPKPPAPAPRPSPGTPSASPPAPPARKFPCHYIIQPGDTLGAVSDHFYGTSQHWRRILEANPGLREKRLRIGRRILIPAPPGHVPPRAAPPPSTATP